MTASAPTLTATGDRVGGLPRLALGVLAAPQLVTGLWAGIAPRHWYDHFPGFGPALVAAEPPFNGHLAADAGAGFLATGAALTVAALWPHRRVVVLALVTYLAFGSVHLAYHARVPAPGLSPMQNGANAVLLAAGVVLALALLWSSRRDHGQHPRPTDGDGR